MDEGSSRAKHIAANRFSTAIQQYSLTPTASRKSTKTLESNRLTIRKRTRRIQSKKIPVEKGRFRLAEFDCIIRNGLTGKNKQNGKSNWEERANQDGTTKMKNKAQPTARSYVCSHTADDAIQPTSGATTIRVSNGPAAGIEALLHDVSLAHCFSRQWCQYRHRRLRTEYQNEAQQLSKQKRSKADRTTQPASVQQTNCVQNETAINRGLGALLPALSSTHCTFDGGDHIDMMMIFIIIILLCFTHKGNRKGIAKGGGKQ